MLLAIALLVIGIIGFVKGRINVTAKRELRGGGMYAVATLFCLPLPLSFLAGIVLGVTQASGGAPVDQQTLMIVSAACVWAPVLVAFVLAFVMAKPKVPQYQPGQPQARGFEVKM